MPNLQTGNLRAAVPGMMWLSIVQVRLALQETGAPCGPLWGREMASHRLWGHPFPKSFLYQKCMVAEIFHQCRPKTKVQKPQHCIIPQAQFPPWREEENKLWDNSFQTLFHVQLVGAQTWHQYRVELGNFCWFYFQSTLVRIVHCCPSSLHFHLQGSHCTVH